MTRTGRKGAKTTCGKIVWGQNTKTSDTFPVEKTGKQASADQEKEMCKSRWNTKSSKSVHKGFKAVKYRKALFI